MKQLILILTLALSISAYAQDDKTVTLIVSGQGKTQEEAKLNALRSAIEQAFGAFISSKTELINDSIIKDEIVSVTNGNINEYKILNESQLPNGRWGMTLNAIVSIDKLTSFVQAKGIAIEIKGGLFALNIKQQLLNEQGEIKAIAEMIGLLHEPIQIAFDYAIKSGNPKSLDAESKNWEIPLVVTAVCNLNIDVCVTYLMKTLSALSLSPNEVESYKSLNKTVFEVNLKYNDQSTTYNLRKYSSIKAIKSLVSNWPFYMRLFAVESGLDTTTGNYQFKFEGLFSLYEFIKPNLQITLPKSGQLVGTFEWNDMRTLGQIEQMTGYKVKPRGVVSKFKGGYVIYEKDNHGLVMAPYDFEIYLNWQDAKATCEELTLFGYSDWYLPSKSELDTIYSHMYKLGIGDIQPVTYWSSTESDYPGHAWTKYFDGNSYSPIKEDKYHVRAIRSF